MDLSPLKKSRHHILYSFCSCYIQKDLSIAFCDLLISSYSIENWICLPIYHWVKSWHIANAKLFFSEKFYFYQFNIFHIFKFFLFIYLFGRQRDREKERVFSSAGSLPKYPLQLRLGQAKARSWGTQSRLPTWVTETQVPDSLGASQSVHYQEAGIQSRVRGRDGARIQAPWYGFVGPQAASEPLCQTSPPIFILSLFLKRYYLFT